MAIVITKENIKESIERNLGANDTVLLSNSKKDIGEFLGVNCMRILPVYMRAVKEILDREIISGSDYVKQVSNIDAFNLQIEQKAAEITQLFAPV